MIDLLFGWIRTIVALHFVKKALTSEKKKALSQKNDVGQ